MSALKKCPCGSGKSYQECCGAILAGQRRAETAEELMRSRYTANARQDAEYLMASWHPSTRPQGLSLDGYNWYELNILARAEGGVDDEQGMVEFRALYRKENMQGVLHERSRFCRGEQGEWLYLDGEIVESNFRRAAKSGRNAPCPCGSGKKYKKCCLRFQGGRG